MEQFDWVMGFILPYINFLIFLILAIKLFKKPLSAMLANRKSDYEASVKEANRARDEAKAAQEELNQRLARLDQEVESMKATAEKEADLAAKKMLSDAKGLAEHLVREARRVADAEVTRAKEEIRSRILHEVKQSTTERLQRDLDDKGRQALMAKALKELSSVRLES